MERNIYFNYLRTWTANSDGTRNTDLFKVGYQEHPEVRFTVFDDDVATPKDLSSAVAWELCIAKDFSHGEPMSRVLDADIDDSLKATGIITANIATAFTTFLAAVGTSKSIPAFMRLKGLDVNSHVVVKILVDITAENDPDPSGGTPLDPVGNYYTKTEGDARYDMILSGTQATLTDDATTNITLFDKTAARKATVEMYAVGAAGIRDWLSFAVTFFGAEAYLQPAAYSDNGTISGAITLNADISSDNVRLNITLAGCGENLKLVYKISQTIIEV